MSATPRQLSHRLLSIFGFDLTTSPCRTIDPGLAGLLAQFTASSFTFQSPLGSQFQAVSSGAA
jgi:hypothetical protein